MTLQSAETKIGASPVNRHKDLVEVNHLVKHFPVRGGMLQRVVGWVQAVDDVSFAVKEGETLGLVGESGCGKTTVGRTMLRLIEPTSGQVLYDGIDVFKLPRQRAEIHAPQYADHLSRPVCFIGPAHPGG